MRKVLITLYRSRCHSLYWQFINHPPKGYEYLTLDDVTEEDIFTSSKNIFGEIANKIRRNRKIIWLAKENAIDLIYCCDGILLFNSPIPWIVDLEHVTGFIAHHFGIWRYAKWVLPIILMQRNLKAIIPWTEAGAGTILENIYHNRLIEDKIRPVPLCLGKVCSRPPSERERKSVDDNHPLVLLFATSINDNTENVFYNKGGKYLTAVYERLRTRIPIRLILRARVPEEFAFLREREDITIYDDSLDADAYEGLFHSSDVFFFPGYQSPGLAFLDAMTHGMAIVTTDVFANSEMVISGYNGYVVPFCEGSRVHHLFREYGIKTVPTGNYAFSDDICEEMVEQFCSTIQLLQGDSLRLESFQKNSKRLFDEKYTLEGRNKLLEEVFNTALCDQKKK